LRTFVDPLTGQSQSSSLPHYDHVALDGIRDISNALRRLDHYKVIVSGQEPPARPPLELEHNEIVFEDTYGFDLHCCLRPEIVSTSYCHGEVPTSRDVPSFGKPCTSTDHTGVFQHPLTGAIIEVPNAGCARFWIEFEFGKWLFPRINNDLNLLNAPIVDCAQESFGTKFVQGFHCY
jgi:hypothetical protein